jgi:integrase/recombinase XerD
MTVSRRGRGAGSRPRRGRRAIDPRTFGSALRALLDELRARWYSKALVKQAGNVLLRFFGYLTSKRVRDLRAVTETHVIGYARHLATTRTAKGTPYTVSTQRSYLTTVQRLFRFLVREGVLLQDPSLNLTLPSWRRLPRAVINQKQARHLVSQPDPTTERGKRDRAILELLYGAAIRVSECERLDVRDLDLVRGQVFVRTGKGRKDRVVPVVGRATEALDIYLRESRSDLVKDPREPALFLDRRGCRLGVKRIQDLVRSHAKAAGIDIRVTPHTLRHGCATHLLQGGADIRHVQKLLGHASVETTAIYTEVTPKDLTKAVEKAHPRERSWKRGAARKAR